MRDSEISDRLWLGEVVDENERIGVRALNAAHDGVIFAISVSDEPEVGAIVAVKGGSGDHEVSIKRVLTSARSAKADLYRLIARHNIDPFYPAEAHAEVNSWLEAPCIDDSTLEDLGDLPFVTIDNKDSRDLDQALFIKHAGQGFEVLYALADAAFYIPPGSSLFAEALKRGSSYYLPGFSVPMIPRLLSEGLVSLNPDQDRRSLVFIMRLDEAGNCLHTRIVRARIRSRRKLSYKRVQRFWDDPFGSSLAREDFRESLELLRVVGLLRIEDAKRRHVVDYHRIELNLRLDGEGNFLVSSRDRFEVEKCNEQISLLCNVEGARLLDEARGQEHVQAIFRVHPAPPVERLAQFEEFVSTLARLHGLDDRWVWKGVVQPLDEYLRMLPRHQRPRVAAVIQRQAILTNRRSLFGDTPGIHHGIGARVYARFSSPMREIVGIFTHKEALEMLGEAEKATPTEQDIELRKKVVDSANRSKALQRTLEKEAGLMVLDQLFSDDISKNVGERPVYRGTFIGMKSHLLYIRLDDPKIEVKLHLRDLDRLTGEVWRSDAIGVEVVPPQGSRFAPLQVGSVVSLRVASYNKKRKYWILAPIP